jgi:site-specific DNA recombinase
LEGLVIERLRAFFAHPRAVLDAIEDDSGGGSGQRQLIERGRQAGEELGAQAPDKVKSILMTLACRVVINIDRIDVKISRHRLTSLLTRQSMDRLILDQGLDHAANDVVTLAVPACLKRVGREMRMLVENSRDQTATDLSLLRIIARAHDIQAPARA